MGEINTIGNFSNTLNLFTGFFNVYASRFLINFVDLCGVHLIFKEITTD